MTRDEICNSMTIQDAVQVLKETNCYGTMDIAKSVIIKALEQQSNEDCISRAEAIKALEYELSIEADGGLDKYRTVIKDLVNAIYNTQKKAIEDLPSIQSQPKERTETHACDCISREALDNAISGLTYWHFENDRLIPGGGGSKTETVYKVDDVWRLTHILPAVSSQPKTEDVRDEKVGHWIMPQQDDGMSDPIYYQVRCSECNFDLDPQTWCQELNQYGADKYCPNCGCRMQEVQQ